MRVAVAVCLPQCTFLSEKIPISARSLSIASTGQRAPADGQGYSVQWIAGTAEVRTATVQVSGLTRASLRSLRDPEWTVADWKRLLSVFAGQESSGAGSELPPMLGNYGVRDGLLIFQPQFPLDPGIVYRAVFHPNQLPGVSSPKKEPIVAIFKAPVTHSEATTVQGIFPTAARLPENLLKFYVHFSAPMSRGNIYEHIRLLDSVGKVIELPFLEIDEELWNPTMTRLTLFIDPGRIKRGVLPLEEIGPALETGKSYSLVIDSGWNDGAGKPLRSDFEKRFSVVAPDRDPPDPKQWQILPPQADTRAPLVVRFPEPLDSALAERLIQVAGDSGRALSGDVTLEDEERRWSFLPTHPWSRGTYQLVVPTNIEDLSGNNIGKPFEVDLFEGIQRRLTSPVVKLSFEVR